MTKHAYADYKSSYEDLLRSARVKPEWLSRVDSTAKKIFEHKEKYKEIEEILGVPWKFIGVIHNLECSLRFDCHLHNGDPLGKKTRLVPAGRPATGKPPFTWEESAVDALKLKELDKETDWSEPKIAYNLERYNGFGYRSKGVNSPYLWSGTDRYSKGKYVSDGKYSKTEVSKQIGAIPLYRRLNELESQEVQHGKKEEKETAHQEKQLLRETSRSYYWTDNITDFYRWATAGIATLGLTEYLGWISAFLSTWKGMLLIGSLLALAWAFAEYSKYKKLQEYKEGRYTPSGIAKTEGKEDVVVTSPSLEVPAQS